MSAIWAVDECKERYKLCFRGRLLRAVMPCGSKLLFKLVSSTWCNNFSLVWYQSDTSELELYDKVTPLTPLKAKPALSNEDIMRYSRQLLLPELGVQGTDGYRQYYSDIQYSEHSVEGYLWHDWTQQNESWLSAGQLNLSQTSVLIVGCGGLGCPLAQYLAAAGIGRLINARCDLVPDKSNHLPFYRCAWNKVNK